MAALAALACGPVFAQTAPTAGSIQQQIEREQPARPPADTPAIRLEQGSVAAAPVADQQKFAVRSVHVGGAHIYSEATLVAATGFGAPREMTLGQLRAMAASIAGYYHQHGYFVAQAYVPAQDIRDGSVTIALLEGRYGQVSVRNRSGVPDALLTDLLAGLRSGDPVAVDSLESRLLLISDLPGAAVKSTLVPGASVGATDLIVDVAPGQRVAGSVDADNQGNRYTGARRLGAALYVNNPSNSGDLLSVRVLTSDTALRYARAAYQAQLGRARASVAYSHMSYRLGDDFEALQARGTASIASLGASYPLLRSRSLNLTTVMNVDFKTFHDEAASTSTLADKTARVALLSLNGNARDGDAFSSFALAWSSGELALQGAAALATDAATVRSNGHYDKLSLQATRVQALGADVELYAAINVQLSSGNLDTSEKIGLGGATGVRAYPSGEAFGDQGHILNLELRTRLPKPSDSLPGQLQLIGFVDTGSVLLNRAPWTVGPNRRTLSGAGIGLTWTQQNTFSVSASVAHKLGNALATSAPDAGSRFWIDAVKYF